ncbi:MAG TPA: hypothetical protein IGS17_06960 [Oscillatoriales cyanobacterium M59_W2019_021]|nr:MAG: hypothetical protein D6728_07665 [Cyanobacteria bacterium J055]HIK32597.1 hypothetical protein [Oscillatoriales cyanobacterium M4454_W2019_049]HIK50652.1 hypothetical protein [Oscillatoriales cyanobacterium M59_W2019_021]
MGKLTDSLRKTAQELDDIESGIDRITNLGQELAENTVRVADAALRVGYNSAPSEARKQEKTGSQPVPKALPEVADLQKKLVSVRTSQNSLKSWNDIYRIQQVLVIKYLKQQKVEAQIIDRVERIFKLKSVRQAPKFASNLLDWEASEIMQLLKKVVRHTSHLLHQ